MKIAVLVPSAEYVNYAGARIRYRRMMPELERRGFALTLCDIGDFRPDSVDADVVIFSKCHDARALVASAIMAARGRIIGVDLFDDYFSQSGDSRMARFRSWLSQILRNCHFALCSTDAMAGVIGKYEPELPVHVMNDPAPEAGSYDLPEVLARKLVKARDFRRLVIAWYGVGDNPHFPVGLRDLAAFGGTLAQLAGTGMDVELRVLTNRRALTANGLALLERLPVRTAVAEWSEDGEAELLTSAFAAFLPVSAQPFSKAKSLNRAVTALSSGCQVLSVGYPLYSKLEPLIYRDVRSLLSDLAKGTMRVSPSNMQSYRGAMDAFASAESEATALTGFLCRMKAGHAKSDPLVLVHGSETNGAAHKLVKAVNGLSVASPYCTTGLGFDVVFNGRIDNLSMFVSENAASRLLPDFRSNIGTASTIYGRKFLKISDHSSPSNGGSPPEEWSEASLSFKLSTYSHAMDQIRSRLNAAFGPCRVLMSETSSLPFALAN